MYILLAQEKDQRGAVIDLAPGVPRLTSVST
jgi:hypothetical protein